MNEMADWFYMDFGKPNSTGKSVKLRSKVGT